MAPSTQVAFTEPNPNLPIIAPSIGANNLLFFFSSSMQGSVCRRTAIFFWVPFAHHSLGSFSFVVLAVRCILFSAGPCLPWEIGRCHVTNLCPYGKQFLQLSQIRRTSNTGNQSALSMLRITDLLLPNSPNFRHCTANFIYVPFTQLFSSPLHILQKTLQIVPTLPI